jgi:hypothetical protein
MATVNTFSIIAIKRQKLHFLYFMSSLFVHMPNMQYSKRMFFSSRLKINHRTDVLVLLQLCDYSLVVSTDGNKYDLCISRKIFPSRKAILNNVLTQKVGLRKKCLKTRKCIFYNIL